MKEEHDRRRFPNVPRPEHGQRRSDRLAARHRVPLTRAALIRWTVIIWSVAVVVGLLVGTGVLRR